MGKHRKPSGRSAGPAKVDTDVLPPFDETALSALTEKIEKGFGKRKAPQQLGDTGSGNRKIGKETNGQRDSDSKTKGKNAEHNRGTKRDAQGNVKVAGKRKAESSSRQKNTKNAGAKDDRGTLLKEILALGGTEEDLDLVAGAASDDEDVEGDNGPAQDKSFKKDLAKFVAGLGIEGAAVEDASEPEAEQEEQGEEEWEEASDLDSPEESDVPDGPEESPKKLATTLPDTKNTDVSSKGPNRLVSMSPL
jgi:ribosome biogenesis protein MAK21